MPITFDAAKRTKTLSERGLDMAQAEKVFGGREITIKDIRRDYGEDRFITFGRLEGRLVVLVWTPRDGGTRIISMRKANDREEKAYGSVV